MTPERNYGKAVSTTKSTSRVPDKLTQSTTGSMNGAYIPEKSAFYSTDIFPSKVDSIIIIEVLITNKQNAIQIINDISEANKNSTTKRVISIALNKKYGDEKIANLDTQCNEIINLMKEKGVIGSCFAFTWNATTSDEKGYIFPFKDARSILTLDHEAISFQDKLLTISDNVIVRSIDQDVFNDPIYDSTKRGDIDNVASSFKENYDKQIFTGGYNWVADRDMILRAINSEVSSTLSETTSKLSKKPAKYAKQTNTVSDEAVGKILNIITIINDYEHQVRLEINRRFEKAIYIPEPNAYMSLETRRKGAELTKNSIVKGMSQQGEGRLFIHADKKVKSVYNSQLSTNKPIKGHLNDLIKGLYTLIKDKSASNLQIEKLIEQTHQSHMSETVVSDIQKWRMNDESLLKVNTYKEGSTDTIKGIAKDYKQKCASAIMAEFK